jgi:hypothetical protein
VSHAGGIIVPQILKTPEIGNLAGREEGISTQIARKEGQPIERYRGSLSFIGQGLDDGEFLG